MELRVTQQTLVNRSLSYERQQTDALAHLQAEASSGNRILAPEDDPLGTVAVINYAAQDARYSTDLTNISTATTNLNVSTSALQSADDVLTSARSLAIQGTNPGNDPTALAALGDQVNALLTRLTDLANTQNNGQYVFSGTRSGTQPFVTDASGNVTYAGGAQRAAVPVGPSQTVGTNYVGSAVFGTQPGGQDAFQALAALRDDLRNTQGLSATAQAQAISGRLGQLDQVKTNVLSALGEQSATLQNLSGLQSQVQGVQLETQKLNGDVQSADIASVVTNLQAQQNLFQATLATTAKMFDASLLNFIK